MLQRWRDLTAGYSDEARPLGAYTMLVIAYNALFGGFLMLARRRRIERRLAEQASLPNLLLLGTATFKLSKLIAKDWVTSPLRAPFTRYDRAASGPEVNESPRGSGMQLALGELLT
jgi:hypothetical protein